MVSKNKFVELKVVMIVFDVTIFANLEKWSTTTKMASKGENPLRCSIQNEKDLILTKVLFSLYFDLHQN